MKRSPKKTRTSGQQKKRRRTTRSRQRPVVLVVGLGNPGTAYDATPHNLGFRAVAALADRFDGAFKHERRFSADVATLRLGTITVLLAKPQTMMNRSGVAVRALATFFRIPASALWVVHDDLDLPIGAVRHSFDSRGAGHRGVQSVIDELGTQAFHRIRLGIGRPDRMAADAYVLRPMNTDMRTATDAALQSVVASFPSFLTEQTHHEMAQRPRHHQPPRRSLGQ